MLFLYGTILLGSLHVLVEIRDGNVIGKSNYRAHLVEFLIFQVRKPRPKKRVESNSEVA